MNTAKSALSEFRANQKSYLSISKLARQDALIAIIREEGRKERLTVYQMVIKIEGSDAIWRKEWE